MLTDWRHRVFGQRTAAFIVVATGLCLSAFGSINAHAANMPFVTPPGLAGESCTIEVINDGFMTLSGNGRELSSKQAGGVRGKTIVTSIKQSPSPTARFEVSVDAPTDFDVYPAGGNDNVTFIARMHGTSINNGINMNNRNGNNPRKLRKNGLSVTEVTIDLISRKPSGQVFPNGSYQATTVVRCE